MLQIEAVLSEQQLADVRALLANARWIDGRVTAGHLSERVKNNQQLDERDPAAQAAGEIVLSALRVHPQFISAALPARIVPPLFNRYAAGSSYGLHIDGAVRPLQDGQLIRTDLSATLCLSDATAYSGGELCIRTGSREESVRLNAGELVLYAAGTLHRVAQVSEGERICAFFWIQSLVRDSSRRELLHSFDQTIQRVSDKLEGGSELLQLHSYYHELLRHWAEP